MALRANPSRTELVWLLFKTFGGDESGFLGTEALYQYARHCGFPGDEEAWAVEYKELATTYDFSPDVGANAVQFRYFVDDTDGIAYIDDDSLKVVLEKLEVDMPVQQTREDLTRKMFELVDGGRGELTVTDMYGMAVVFFDFDGAFEDFDAVFAELREKHGWDGEGPTSEQLSAFVGDAESPMCMSDDSLHEAVAELEIRKRSGEGLVEQFESDRQRDIALIFDELRKAEEGASERVLGPQMKRLVDLMEYPGDDEEWKQDFQRLCEEHGCDVAEGLSLEQLARILSDPQSECFVETHHLPDLAQSLQTGVAELEPGRARRVIEVFWLLCGAQEQEALTPLGLLRLAKYKGFPGTEKDWEEEYSFLREERGWGDAGVTQVQLAQYMADESSTGYCGLQDLDLLLADLREEVKVERGMGFAASRTSTTSAGKSSAGDADAPQTSRRKSTMKKAKRPSTASKSSKATFAQGSGSRRASAKSSQGRPSGQGAAASARRPTWKTLPTGIVDATGEKLGPRSPAAPEVGQADRQAKSRKTFETVSSFQTPAGGDERRLGICVPGDAEEAPKPEKGEPPIVEKEPVLELSKQEVMLAIFAALDGGGKGALRSQELLRYAKLCGWEGQDSDWNQEYLSLCAGYKCDPVRGTSLPQFAKLIRDEKVRPRLRREELLAMLQKLEADIRPQMSRSQLISAVFGALDSDKVGRLHDGALHRLAVWRYFDASEAEWRAEYRHICRECGADPLLGLTYMQFVDLVANRDGSVHCTSNDLRGVLAELELEGRSTKLIGRYVAALRDMTMAKKASERGTSARKDPQMALLRRLQDDQMSQHTDFSKTLAAHQAQLDKNRLDRLLKEKEDAKAMSAKASDAKVRKKISKGTSGMSYLEQQEAFEEEMRVAATKIQSVMRGAMVRRSMLRRSRPEAAEEEILGHEISSMWGALLVAIANGHQKRALGLLQSPSFEGANATDMRDCTALHASAEMGQDAVVKALLSHPPFKKALARDWLGWNALHRAARSNRGNAAVQLLSNKGFGAGPTAAGRNLMTPLHLAALHGNMQVVARLLGDLRFQEVNAVDKWGRTALHIAAEQGHIEACEAIIKSPRFTRIAGVTKWFATAMDVAKNDDVRTAMREAAKEGGLQAIQYEKAMKEAFRLIVSGDFPDKLRELLEFIPLTVWTAWRNRGGYALPELCDERKRVLSAALLRSLILEARRAEGAGAGHLVGRGLLPGEVERMVAVFKGLHYHAIDRADFIEKIRTALAEYGVSDRACARVHIRLKEGSSSKNTVVILHGNGDDMKAIGDELLGRALRVGGHVAVLQEESELQVKGDAQATPRQPVTARVADKPQATARPAKGTPSKSPTRQLNTPSPPSRTASGGSRGSPVNLAKARPGSPPGTAALAQPTSPMAPRAKLSAAEAKTSPMSKTASSASGRPKASSASTAWKKGDPAADSSTPAKKGMFQLREELAKAGVQQSRILGCKNRSELEALHAQLQAKEEAQKLSAASKGG